MWHQEFRDRMHGFEARRSLRPGEAAVSVKVRVVSGCFHREHSPHAYEIIDEHLRSIPPNERHDFSIEEHESGPELLVYLAMATAGITLAKSVIDLITTILKARSESVKKGDRPSDPVEIIIRRVETDGKFHEETVLRIGHSDPIHPEEIERRLKDAAKRLLGTGIDIGS
jgi:hypothetical protein